MSRDRLHVLIAGGGVAALESLLALRALAGERVDITLPRPRRDFLFRPTAVAGAFDAASAATRSTRSRRPCRPDHPRSLEGSTRAIGRRHGRRHRIPFDALIVAGTVASRFRARSGSRPRRRRRAAHVVADAVAGDVRRSRSTSRGATWALPAYELALLTAGALREQWRAAVVVARHARGAAARAVRPKARAPSRLCWTRGRHPASHPSRPSAVSVARAYSPKALRSRGPGDASEVRGPGITAFPTTSRFHPVDEHGRLRASTASTPPVTCTAFPLKQGGLAAQQADAVARRSPRRSAPAAGQAVSPRAARHCC